MCDLFGTKKAAKRQAAAIKAAAEMEAKNQNLQAQAAVQQTQTMIAQKNAADKAAKMLAIPTDQVDVQLADGTSDAEIDPGTGRRRTSRSVFMANRASPAASITI